ncbi:MAG: alpha-L-arabinofuranosidase [Terriglobia bacterium]
MSDRRQFLKECTLALAGSALTTAQASAAAASKIVVHPDAQFEISPYLYMQFMEPLGVTDSSVAAAWDYDADNWRNDFVETVQDLAPGVIRFGGLFSRYYRWREGVGPPDDRPRMRNYVWGGFESNRVGTGEFVQLCKSAGAEPLYCVNFLSDGRREYWKRDRTGDAREAADWVSYANAPDNSLRKAHGFSKPFNIKLWQLGNETSYGTGGFTQSEAVDRTIEFAAAMKEKDNSIQLIGWGDRSPGPGSPLWAGEMLDRAGEYLDYVAIHMMGQHPARKNTVLNGLRYERNPEQAWDEMLELSNQIEARVVELEEIIRSRGSKARIAITEGHLSLRPANANPILREWLSAAYHARSMNIYQRHGALVKIATAADFCGTRWTSNAVMIQVPRGVSYFLPAGSVMRLFKKYNGTHAVAVTSSPAELDIAASRSGNEIFLHVANLSYARAVGAELAIEGRTIAGCRVIQIAPDNLRQRVDEDQHQVFRPIEATLPRVLPVTCQFPAGSVSAVVIRLKN